MDLIDLIQAESTLTIKNFIESNGIPIDSRWLDYESLNVALYSKRADVAMMLLKKDCRVNKSFTSDNLNLKVDTPLHHAVLLNDLDIVQHLLNKKASITATNSKGNTPLHLAFMLKREVVVDILLAFIKKTSVYENSRNNQGLTHFHIACTRKDESIIKRFLKDGADVKDAVSKKSLLWAGFNALHFAANSKSLEAVRTLVTKSDINLQSKNANGLTPYRLAYQQLEDMLVMLDFLSQGSDCNSREYNYFSYFHMACFSSYPNDVRNFIRKGADVNKIISLDDCPYGGQTPLFFAIENVWDHNVEVLLENGADVCQLDNEGMTPLHLTFYAKNIDGQEELIDKMYAEFDKNMTYADGNGLNLLHIACSRNDIDTVTKILDSGKNVNKVVSYKKRDFYRFTPLHFAVKYGHVHMAKLLIERGANVNANDDWAHGTPLHLAFTAGHKELIELLLKSGADPQAIQISYQKTMLHCLVEQNNEKEELLEYVEYLVMRSNVNVNAKDKLGWTALSYAWRNLRLGAKWIRLLLEFGADINLVDDSKDYVFTKSLSELSSDNAINYMVLYHHIQKLIVLGLSVHTENEVFCEKLKNKCQELGLHAKCFKNEMLVERHRQDEIDRMTRAKLTKNVSLRDFLLLNGEETCVYARNKILKKIVLEDLLDYPTYAYLIRLQYRKAIDSENPSKMDTRSEARKAESLCALK